MLPIALSILGYGKMIAQSVFAWLSKRSLAEIGCLILCITCGVLLISNRMEKRHSAKVEAQLAKCADANKRLAAQSRAQQQQVAKTVEHYITVTKPEVRTIVQKIESAPLPGNCKSPKEVLDADV